MSVPLPQHEVIGADDERGAIRRSVSGQGADVLAEQDATDARDSLA